MKGVKAMDGYKHNAKWLTYLAPFRMLSISAAYLTPFFLQHGMSMAQVFGLQSIFSAASLAWEIPSGYIADKLGRAFSIKLSAPVAAVAMIAYGFSGHFWQFVVCELVLALANGLISGVDVALLIDSLKAEGREDQYVRLSQRMDAAGYAAVALGVPIAFVLVKYVNISSTLVADGVLTGVGACFFSLRLVEAPRFNGGQEAKRLSAWRAVKELLHTVEARWLLALGAVLSSATYLASWLAAPYYQSMGIPAVLFGLVLAVRSLWKAWLSHKFHRQKHLERNMFVYAALAGLVYLAMASRQLWLVWAVLGHDVVQALHARPVSDHLNVHIDHEHRATMNSVANLVRRLVYTVSGPLVGWLADYAGLQISFVVTGAVCSLAAFVILARLHKLKTFKRR
jgi:MFS family permease